MAKQKTKNNKVVGYNDKDKDVYNSIKDTYIGSEGKNLAFLKDPNKLLHAYDNLIRKLGKTYSKVDLTYSEQQELYAYIQETFLDLVVEFDMENSMDFPGYIKSKLEKRIKGSYLPSQQKYKNHIAPLKGELTTIEYLLDQKYDEPNYTISYRKNKETNERKMEAKATYDNVRNEIDDELIELEKSIKDHSLNVEMLLDIINLISYQGLTKKETSDIIQEKYHLNQRQFNNLLEELKTYLQD